MSKKRQQVCQWFARCASPATTTRPGPVLQPEPHWGEIPVCSSCADRIDHAEHPTR